MKVLIAGATGVLGRRLVQQLRSRGHNAIALVRSEKGEQIVQSLGADSCWVDLFDAEAIARAASGVDVVIHAATSIPVKNRTTPADWEMNDRLRRAGTQALTTAAAKVGARLYIQQSVIWVARPDDGSFFDETTRSNPHPIVRSALDGEIIAQEAGAHYGFNVSVLRCGAFYGADAAHTQQFAKGLIHRKLPILGRGNAVWALLHVDDAANAFVTTAEANKSGIWHVVDDRPVTVAEFLTTFADKLNSPKPHHIPLWLARLVAGQAAVDYFTTSAHTSNSKFCQTFGWTPRFSGIREGLDQVVATWKAQGWMNLGGQS